MRTIIAGCRTYNCYETVVKAVKDSGFEITQIVSGGAKGVDKLGERYAKEHNIPLVVFLPDWDKYKKSGGKKNPAGVIRNADMAKNADALIALWDTKSAGTGSMVNLAKVHGLKTYIHEIPDQSSKMPHPKK